MENRSYVIIAFLIVTLVYFVYLISILYVNGSPAGYSEYGTLGDAFGTLNSLFSGLGFAGIVVTLIVQQKQIIEQEKENSEQQRRYQIDNYEKTIYQILELYKAVLDEVMLATEEKIMNGRDVLQISVKNIQDIIRRESTSFYPEEIREMIVKGNLCAEHNELMQFIQYEHHKIIKNNLVWQGRLIQTAEVLFNHLETNCPQGYDISFSRRIVMSQLTHIECHYLFLVCLQTKKKTEMAVNMSRSIFNRASSKFKMMDIHRHLFESVYGVNLLEGVVSDVPYINRVLMRLFKKRGKEMRAKYRLMIGSSGKNKSDKIDEDELA